jgi:DNA gyrase inhibitor GyrI
MKRKSAWILVTGGLLGVVGIAFITTSRAGYETASYDVVEKDGKFEIRNYRAHKVVTTSMKSSAENGSFGRLFQYISGKNEGEQKIAMTTPVFMPATEDGKTQEMQFVIPSDVAASGAPAPSSSAVKVKSMSGGKYAVLRFSGTAKSEQRKAKLAELRAELEKRKIKTTGKPIFAGYDPPWTPGPMRRNEVLLKVSS